MPARRPPSPPCPTGGLYRRAALQAIPTAAMPARRPPSPPCPPGDPYRRAALQAFPTTALLYRSSPPPPREIPAAALPSGKTRFSPEIYVEKEGYYLLEDAEGYFFRESDGCYYFFQCFKGEGYYYHSEESEYFHAGESLYVQEYGLETLDAHLQRLALDGDYGGEVGEGLHHHGDFDKLGLDGDFDKLGLRLHMQDDYGLQTLDTELQRLALDADNSGKVGEALGSCGKVSGKVAQGLHGNFDKPGLHRDFDKLGLRFHKQGQGLHGDSDNLGLRFHKQGQDLEEHCKGVQVPDGHCKGGQVLDDDFVDGDSPCLKALEASGVSGRRLFARRV
ncbi:uncharacterized protein LOC119323411 [Triticum dicoccoides]|uniref:uncharacterized protein LOC119323411 n=1 Tax=Triticum dicoccoides TaxID=85692 RepID=UPI0018910153|nr:uncharacterized protein LOC119323411 [Triticum dicoccoides]